MKCTEGKLRMAQCLSEQERDGKRVEAICGSNGRSGRTFHRKTQGLEEKVTLVLALLTKPMQMKVSKQCYLFAGLNRHILSRLAFVLCTVQV